MSRFFGDSDAETDENESGDDQTPSAHNDASAAAGRFLMDSDSSEEEKRVVRSEKDKRYEELQKTADLIRNQLKINDWNALTASFDLILKQLQKAKTVTSKEGIPRFFFKTVLSIEEAMKSALADKEAKKKLSKINAKALNALKQKIKKQFTLEFAAELEVYAKNPLLSDEEAASDDDAKKKKKKPKKEKKEKPQKKPEPEEEEEDGGEGDEDQKDDGGDEGDDGEEFDWDSSSSEDDDDESKDKYDFTLDKNKAMFTRAFWLKSAATEDDVDAKQKRKEERKKKQEQREAEKLKEREEEDKKQQQGDLGLKKEPQKEEEYTADMVLKKLKELLLLRGKRGTDRKQVVNDLVLLSSKAHKAGQAAVLKVKVTLVQAIFDTALNKGTPLDTKFWKQATEVLVDILESLEQNPLVRMSEDEKVEQSFDDELDEDDAMTLESVGRLMTAQDEKQKEEQQKAEEERRRELEKTLGGTTTFVTGNVFAFVQQTFAEFRKSLQNTDPYKPEYIQRLRDEPLLYTLLNRCSRYYQSINKIDFQTQVALLQLELIHYHFNPQDDAQVPAAKAWAEAREEKFALGGKPLLVEKKTVVPTLAAFVYKNGNARQHTKAVLYHVYWHALHNRFTEARDLLLMSHTPDTINYDPDVMTKILYNRTMAQLGLSAFRTGDFRSALYSLSELYNSPRIKELIAQGTSSKYKERDPKKERIERARQFPFHQHLNLDTLEATHLLSGMLVEVPIISLYGAGNRRRIVSKAFRRHFDNHMKQAFTGPPENTKENIMAATKALLKGDWAACQGFIEKLKMWRVIPNGEFIKSTLAATVKELSLQVYLLRYGAQYVSIGKKSLEDMFSLDSRAIHRIVSKMIVDQQLQAAWDEPTNSLVIQAARVSRLQKTALAYADKVQQMVEQNEKLLDHPRGRFGRDEKKGGWWADQRNQGTQSWNKTQQRKGNATFGKTGGGYKADQWSTNVERDYDRWGRAS